MEDYIGHLDLSNSEDYQFVYASQLYGTFFCIYAHFNADDSLAPPSCDTAELSISNVKFKIVNYKGSVNLGITDVNHVALINGNGIEIKIELQAMNGSIEFPYTLNECFSENDKILVTRALKPLNLPGASANAIPLQNLNEIFDTEAWERNGLVLPIKRQDTHEVLQSQLNVDQDQVIVMAPGRSCLSALFYVKK